MTVYMVSLLPPSATPILFSSIVEYLKFDEAQAGFIASSALFALAVGTICVAGLIGRIRNRVLVIFGCAVAVSTTLLSTTVTSFTPLAIFQLLAGFGFGILYGTANAVLASSGSPDRNFATAILGTKIVAALMLFVLPSTVIWFKEAGVFYFLAAALSATIPLMVRIPDHINPSDIAHRKATFKLNHTVVGILIVLATFMFFLVNGAAWAMSSQIGQIVGVPLENIGFILGIVVVVGMLGPLMAAWLGTRYGRAPPLILGIFFNILAIFILFRSQTTTTYVFCLILFDITFLFIHPYLLGAASDLDKAGRWVVVSSSVGMVGFGLAPAVSGLFLKNFGMTSLGWMAIVGTISLYCMLAKVLVFLKSLSVNSAKGHVSAVPIMN